MRAALISSTGEPPEVTDIPAPEPGAGEALVRMSAAALNPVETHIWAGRFFDGPPQTPYVPGVEGVGVVERGDRLPAGTRVRVEFVHPGYGRNGALAEHVVVPEEPDESDRASQAMAFPLSDSVNDATGAALGAAGGTALKLLDRAQEAGAQMEGAVVLVMGATGTVGSIALQLARRLGASRVIAAGRNPERLERARELGADAAVELDGDPEALRERFGDASGGQLDVVLDPLWGAPARAAMEALTAGGVFVNFGQAAGLEAELPSLPLRNHRVALVGHSGAWSTSAERRATFERVVKLAADGGVTVDVEELPLDEMPTAWERLKGSAGAKLVIRPGT